MTTTHSWTTQRYLVVDVEGNGARPPDLVELAMVPITSGTIGTPISWLVRPSSPITWQARKVHGITNDQVADLTTFDAVRDSVTSHVADEVVVVGHNVRVDLDVLRRKLPSWQPHAVLDTLRLARALLPDLPSRKLGALVDHLDLATELPAGLQPHRATYDALVTARLFAVLATRDDGSPRDVAELNDLGGLPQPDTTAEAQPGLF
ncbi:3'-5' exonuclease [Amycolatopsis sp. K13G38]|uniref:3'-5' exonuclease n=1 Tax=Amycolatopsis acididurans TaxID=2724524 RepID=A0ABX1J7I1_9PSEU|nr:3'-5' exonuclease [Amycolatopsis acididurans]NKQ55619.1 3'-5' exonuclease [Amycolatopsis acididurans]